jgi:hypothetical protein
MSRIRSNLTFANVTSMIALLVALSGTALALQDNTVKSRHIDNGHVRSPDLGALKVRYKDGKRLNSAGTPEDGLYETSEMLIKCREGETAITGGAGFINEGLEFGNEEQWIQDSYPTFFNAQFEDPTAWYVAGGNDSGDPTRMRGFVVCLRAGS